MFYSRFVDRDMVMRFRGGGVGHASTRAATDIFKEDRDTLDAESRDARHGQQQPTESQEEDFGSDQEDGNPVNSEENQATEGHWHDEDLSESELIDYGYEEGEGQDGDDEEGGDDEEDSEEDEEDAGGEDDVIDELAALGFAEY